MTEADIASWQEETGPRLLARVGVGPGKAVLDFGCREGNYAVVAARLVGASGTVYALDKNREALDKLMRRAADEGLSSVVRVDTSGGVPLPLPDASVDVVLLYDVLHLIGWSGGSGKTARRSTAAERAGVLKELSRAARAGAVVSAYCPHLETHTDVESERDIAGEIEDHGFRSRDAFHAELLHDGKRVRGHVLNFVKRGRE